MSMEANVKVGPVVFRFQGYDLVQSLEFRSGGEAFRSDSSTLFFDVL